jgi:exosortase/archaeosortase family protein
VLTIVYLALFSASLPGREELPAAVHALLDFKILWLCVLISLWRIVVAPHRAVRTGDVAWGGLIIALAALTAGVWSWLLLAAFALLFLRRTDQHEIRHALYLVLAIGIHESVVGVLGEVFGDTLLALDASVAELLTHWFLPAIHAYGTSLQATGGHTVMLVWGCSSFSYVGDMMLLCWAVTLLRGHGEGTGRSLWKWLALVALFTVALNAVRLALMAAAPHTYDFLHDGAGAVIFRIIILSGAVGVAWLQSVYAAHKSLRIA